MSVTVARTWYRVDRPDIQEVHDKIISIIENEGLAQYCIEKSPIFKGYYSTTRNLTRNIGLCRYNRYDHDYIIRLSPKLLTMSMDKITSVMIHEIAHAYMAGDGHGHNWAWLANIIRHRMGIEGEVTRCESDKEILDVCCSKMEARYEVQCPCCGTTWHRSRMSDLIRYPMFYKCKTCNQNLIRTK